MNYAVDAMIVNAYCGPPIASKSPGLNHENAFCCLIITMTCTRLIILTCRVQSAAGHSFICAVGSTALPRLCLREAGGGRST